MKRFRIWKFGAEIVLYKSYEDFDEDSGEKHERYETIFFSIRRVKNNWIKPYYKWRYDGRPRFTFYIGEIQFNIGRFYLDFYADSESN